MGSCESTFLFQITLNTVGIGAAMNYAYNNTMNCNGFSFKTYFIAVPFTVSMISALISLFLLSHWFLYGIIGIMGFCVPLSTRVLTKLLSSSCWIEVAVFPSLDQPLYNCWVLQLQHHQWQKWDLYLCFHAAVKQSPAYNKKEKLSV